MSSILRICGKRREYVALRLKEKKNLVYVVYILEDMGGVCISCTFNSSVFIIGAGDVL